MIRCSVPLCLYRERTPPKTPMVEHFQMERFSVPPIPSNAFERFELEPKRRNVVNYFAINVKNILYRLGSRIFTKEKNKDCLEEPVLMLSLFPSPLHLFCSEMKFLQSVNYVGHCLHYIKICMYTSDVDMIIICQQLVKAGRIYI